MRSILLAGLLLATPALATPALAQAPSITIAQPWARATTAAAKAGGVFLTISGAATADRLLSASTPAAGMAELHRTVNEGGVMKMLPVEGLPIGPGDKVELKPGGLHIMLMDLKHPLKQGETFPLLLRFEKAGTVTATVTVAGPGAGGPMTGHATPKP